MTGAAPSAMAPRMTMRPLQDRIAVVTGASRGLGRAMSLSLAAAGAHVVALARTQGALEALDDEIKALGGTATLVPCDMKDVAALDRLGPALFQRWGKLDIFVGNAGVLGPLTPLAQVEPRDWETIVAVNGDRMCMVWRTTAMA